MKQLTSLLSVLLILFTLLACGESHLVDDSDQPTLKQHIFVLPDRLTGQPYNYAAPATTVYLDTNKSFKFWAAYSIDDRFITSDSAEDHFLNHNWIIDGEKYNISPLRFKFSTPGYRQGILETVDLLNDTLRDTVNIFVNTPASIGIVAPINGFNQVYPGMNGSVDLRWTFTGLDPWEESTCYIYASYEKDYVWKTPIGVVDCSEEVAFKGSFLGDSLTSYIMEHPERDTSVTIYWGVKAVFYTEDGFEERDSSDIFHFSTLFLHTDSAIISIPIVYDNLRNSSTHTRVIITSSTGDTLDLQETSTSPTTITSRILPQTSLRIHVYDVSKTEFEAEDITISTYPSALTAIDTIHLQDKILPQLAPLQNALRFGDSIAFYALDNGAGINPNRIFVIQDSDTLDFSYDEPFIKFKSRCYIECNVRIIIEDNARNANSKVFWKLKPKTGYLDSLFISGPFTEFSGEP